MGIGDVVMAAVRQHVDSLTGTFTFQRECSYAWCFPSVAHVGVGRPGLCSSCQAPGAEAAGCIHHDVCEVGRGGWRGVVVVQDHA